MERETSELAPYGPNIESSCEITCRYICSNDKRTCTILGDDCFSQDRRSCPIRGRQINLES